jgi:hypothetical protein
MLGTTWLRNGQMNRSRIRIAPRQYSQGAAETPKNIDCWDAAESLSLPGLRSLVEAAAAIARRITPTLRATILGLRNSGLGRTMLGGLPVERFNFRHAVVGQARIAFSETPTVPVEIHSAHETDGVSRADTRSSRTTHEKEVQMPGDLPSHALFFPRLSSASPVLVATIEICLVQRPRSTTSAFARKLAAIPRHGSYFLPVVARRSHCINACRGCDFGMFVACPAFCPLPRLSAQPLETSISDYHRFSSPQLSDKLAASKRSLMNSGASACVGLASQVSRDCRLGRADNLRGASSHHRRGLASCAASYWCSSNSRTLLCCAQ